MKETKIENCSKLLIKSLATSFFFLLPDVWHFLWPLSFFGLAYFYSYLVRIYQSKNNLQKQFYMGLLWSTSFLGFARVIKQRGLLTGLSQLLPSFHQHLSAYLIYIIISSYLILLFGLISPIMKLKDNCYWRIAIFTFTLGIIDSFQTAFIPEYLDLYLYSNDYIASASGIISIFGIKIIFLSMSAVLGEVLLKQLSFRKATHLTGICIAIIISTSFLQRYQVEKSRSAYSMRIALVQTNLSAYSTDSHLIKLDSIIQKINHSFQPNATTVDVFFPEYSFVDEESNRLLIREFQKKIVFPTRIHAGFSEYSHQGIKNTIKGFSPNGEILYTYDKQELFPIGEKSIIFPIVPESWSRAQIPILKGKSSEHNIIPLTQDIAMIPLICYEGSISSIYRERLEQARKAEVKTIFFANFSKDSYLERTPTLAQWSLHSKREAARNRKYILRVSTTEYTEIVSPDGRIIAKLPAHKEGVLAMELPLYKF